MFLMLNIKFVCEIQLKMEHWQREYAKKLAILQAPSFKIPNSKHQITNKSQISILNVQNIGPARSLQPELRPNVAHSRKAQFESRSNVAFRRRPNRVLNFGHCDLFEI
jgi:hypothetical protein